MTIHVIVAAAAICAAALAGSPAQAASLLQLAAGPAISIPSSWVVTRRKPHVWNGIRTTGTDAMSPDRKDAIGEHTVSGFEPLNRFNWRNPNKNDLFLLRMMVTPLVAQGLTERGAQMTRIGKVRSVRYAGAPALFVQAEGIDADKTAWTTGVWVMQVSASQQGLVYWACRKGSPCVGRSLLNMAGGS